MKVILSTFNKGGVGKTTLAVHIAGVLAEDPFCRVLIVDCVDQYDSFRFIVGCEPQQKLSTSSSKFPNVTVLWNPDRSNLRKVLNSSEYDFVILDLNSPLKDTVQAIVNTHPAGIFLPINKQALVLYKLKDTLALISAMGDYAGYSIPVTIVPMGANYEEIENELQQNIGLLNSMQVSISQPIKFHPEFFENALREGRFVWEYENCQYIKDILKKALAKI